MKTLEISTRQAEYLLDSLNLSINNSKEYMNEAFSTEQMESELEEIKEKEVLVKHITDAFWNKNGEFKEDCSIKLS